MSVRLSNESKYEPHLNMISVLIILRSTYDVIDVVNKKNINLFEDMKHHTSELSNTNKGLDHGTASMIISCGNKLAVGLFCIVFSR